MGSIRRLAALTGAAMAIGVLVMASEASAAGGGGGAQASVVGGSTAKIEDYPWLAFIEGNAESDFSFSCTGTVIAPRVVLTAGHCVEDLEAEVLENPAGYRVATGVANSHQVPKENLSGVARALVFPGFRPNLDHGDAGLLILKRPSAAPAIPLAGAGDSALLAPETPIEIAGWGVSNFERGTAPALLRRAALKLQSTARCRRGATEFHERFSPAIQLCALDVPGFAASGCFGDSGGPAIAHRPDGSPVQIGIITSGGYECETREPNLYTRVDRVSQWAGEWVAAVETGRPRAAGRAPAAPVHAGPGGRIPRHPGARRRLRLAAADRLRRVDLRELQAGSALALSL